MKKPLNRKKTAPNPKSPTLDRINRLAGQVRALGNMVAAGDDWKKILTLSSAIEGASDQVTAELFQAFVDSVTKDKGASKEIREALDLVLKRL